MAFDKWWKEYCVRNHIRNGDIYELMIRPIAGEFFSLGYREGYDRGYSQGYENGQNETN